MRIEVAARYGNAHCLGGGGGNHFCFLAETRNAYRHRRPKFFAPSRFRARPVFAVRQDRQLACGSVILSRPSKAAPSRASIQGGDAARITTIPAFRGRPPTSISKPLTTSLSMKSSHDLDQEDPITRRQSPPSASSPRLDIIHDGERCRSNVNRTCPSPSE